MNAVTKKRALLSFALASVLFVALCIHAFLPPVPEARLSQISRGLPQANVERILGRPVERQNWSIHGGEMWRYNTPLRFGWVDVFFDKDGDVVEYNYERF